MYDCKIGSISKTAYVFSFLSFPLQMDGVFEPGAKDGAA
ncbi:hypothetical protein QSI_4196 [Clostridioides difficile P28]|nr:hypothetical protein QSI_4196 [Clostridioides difficile P28]